MTDQVALMRPEPLDVRASALFLDLDGTLAPIVARPQDVRPLASRSSLLRALDARLNGRLAVISGRTIAEVDHILEGAVACVAGVHGLERRGADGRIERPPPDPGLALARAGMAALVARYPALLIEDKHLSLAIHLRASPEADEAVRRFAADVAARTALILQSGDNVVELRGPGPRKGDAIGAFMQAPPFVGARPVFLGDDLTDEDGFAALRALGGEGVLVGPARPTAALRRLADVEAVFAWLSDAVSGTCLGGVTA